MFYIKIYLCIDKKTTVTGNLVTNIYQSYAKSRVHIWTFTLVRARVCVFLYLSFFLTFLLFYFHFFKPFFPFSSSFSPSVVFSFFSSACLSLRYKRAIYVRTLLFSRRIDRPSNAFLTRFQHVSLICTLYRYVYMYMYMYTYIYIFFFNLYTYICIWIFLFFFF